MEHTYPDIKRKIADAFAGLTPQLQTAAQFLLEHPEDVALYSMRAVARSANASAIFRLMSG